MTANAVASLSLDPVLLLVCFDNGARTLPRSSAPSASASTCSPPARRSSPAASPPSAETKFADVPHSVHDGIPVLDGALAWVGCDLDRLVPAATTRSGSAPSRRRARPRGEPLIWFRGGYSVAMTAVHIVLGVAVVVVNLAAGLLGA